MKDKISQTITFEELPDILTAKHVVNTPIC